MDVRRELALLKDLQAIDLTLHDIHQELETLPKTIADIEAVYLVAKQSLDAHRHELQELEKTKRLEELEVQTSVDHLAQREAKLYAIKTTKEYQAAIKEVADTKKSNRDREDRILQMMERLEQLHKNTTQLETDFADKDSAYTAKVTELKGHEEELKKKIAEVSVRRPELVTQIDVKLLRKYDIVRSHYADVLAEVVKGVCSGCHMNVPPQLYNEIRRLEEMKSCPSCHRLLHTL